MDMKLIKIFIIPWIPWYILLLLQVHGIGANLCDQQASSAFHLHKFGEVESKEDCHQLCCEKKHCHLSITSSSNCYGITCSQPDLCKDIKEQLANFEGHRVDKRSLTAALVHTNPFTGLFHKNDSSYIDTEESKSLEISKRFIDGDNDDNNDDGKEDDATENNASDEKHLEDVGHASHQECLAGDFQKSILPKRKKGFHIRKLQAGSRHLQACSKKCCHSENCVLAFLYHKSCYGVVCSADKSCHTKKDHLPLLKLYFSAVKREHKKRHPSTKGEHRHHLHHHKHTKSDQEDQQETVHKVHIEHKHSKSGDDEDEVVRNLPEVHKHTKSDDDEDEVVRVLPEVHTHSKSGDDEDEVVRNLPEVHTHSKSGDDEDEVVRNLPEVHKHAKTDLEDQEETVHNLPKKNHLEKNEMENDIRLHKFHHENRYNMNDEDDNHLKDKSEELQSMTATNDNEQISDDDMQHNPHKSTLEEVGPTISENVRSHIEKPVAGDYVKYTKDNFKISESIQDYGGIDEKSKVETSFTNIPFDLKNNTKEFTKTNMSSLTTKVSANKSELKKEELILKKIEQLEERLEHKAPELKPTQSTIQTTTQTTTQSTTQTTTQSTTQTTTISRQSKMTNEGSDNTYAIINIPNNHSSPSTHHFLNKTNIRVRTFEKNYDDGSAFSGSGSGDYPDHRSTSHVTDFHKDHKRKHHVSKFHNDSSSKQHVKKLQLNSKGKHHASKLHEDSSSKHHAAKLHKDSSTKHHTSKHHLPESKNEKKKSQEKFLLPKHKTKNEGANKKVIKSKVHKARSSKKVSKFKPKDKHDHIHSGEEHRVNKTKHLLHKNIARDQIERPDKKILQKIEHIYGHKEDIFKEFEKFRQLYESSGYENDSGSADISGEGSGEEDKSKTTAMKIHPTHAPRQVVNTAKVTATATTSTTKGKIIVDSSFRSHLPMSHHKLSKVGDPTNTHVKNHTKANSRSHKHVNKLHTKNEHKDGELQKSTKPTESPRRTSMRKTVPTVSVDAVKTFSDINPLNNTRLSPNTTSQKPTTKFPKGNQKKGSPTKHKKVAHSSQTKQTKVKQTKNKSVKTASEERHDFHKLENEMKTPTHKLPSKRKKPIAHEATTPRQEKKLKIKIQTPAINNVSNVLHVNKISTANQPTSKSGNNLQNDNHKKNLSISDKTVMTTSKPPSLNIAVGDEDSHDDIVPKKYDGKLPKVSQTVFTPLQSSKIKQNQKPTRPPVKHKAFPTQAGYMIRTTTPKETMAINAIHAVHVKTSTLGSSRQISTVLPKTRHKPTFHSNQKNAALQPTVTRISSKTGRMKEITNQPPAASNAKNLFVKSGGKDVTPNPFSERNMLHVLQNTMSKLNDDQFDGMPKEIGQPKHDPWLPQLHPDKMIQEEKNIKHLNYPNVPPTRSPFLIMHTSATPRPPAKDSVQGREPFIQQFPMKIAPVNYRLLHQKTLKNKPFINHVIIPTQKPFQTKPSGNHVVIPTQKPFRTKPPGNHVVIPTQKLSTKNGQLRRPGYLLATVSTNQQGKANGGMNRHFGSRNNSNTLDHIKASKTNFMPVGHLQKSLKKISSLVSSRSSQNKTFSLFPPYDRSQFRANSSIKKETPEETVNRILGHKVMEEKNSKTSKLDDFFKERDVTVSPPGKKNELTSRRSNFSTPASHFPQKHDKLESFFRNAKTEKKNDTKAKTTVTISQNRSKISKPHKNILHVDKEFIGQQEERALMDAVRKDKGCNIIGDVKNRLFKTNVENVLTLPTATNLSECVNQCCRQDNCQVAFFENMKCKLVECKNITNCKSLIPTTRNVRLVYLRKEVKSKLMKNDILFCEQEQRLGMKWSRTQSNSSLSIRCPRDAIGEANRFCDADATWTPADFSKCISKDYLIITNKMKSLGHGRSAGSIMEELDDITTQNIDNAFVFGGDLQKATNIISDLHTFITNNKAELVNHKDLRSITRSISNLLDESNKQEWMNIKKLGVTPLRLIRSLNDIGLHAAKKLGKPMKMKPVITHSILLSVAKIGKNQHEYIFPNYSIPLSNEWTTRKDTIMIPHSIFEHDSPTCIASMSYKTLSHLLPHQWNIKKHVTFTDGFVINSNVLTTVVDPKPDWFIKQPVVITLHHLKEKPGESKCAFWNQKGDDDDSGGWSTDGCLVISSNKTVTVCQCNHLTSFAVLTNTNEESISSKEQTREHTIAAVWLGVPLTIILLLGSLYTCFAWSKSPRRRHIVIMDKKPVLPDDEIIITKTVSEKYPGSPNRLLYGANATPSPSELEWEHAWDFLTNSDFDVLSKKQLQGHFRSKIKFKHTTEENIEVTHTTSLKSHEEPSTVSQTVDSSVFCFQWKHQDDSEWSKERIKCLGKGLFDVSYEHAQPLTEDGCLPTLLSNEQESVSEQGFCLDNFSPLGMSSPHSLSLEEVLNVNRSRLQKNTSYLQISFDADLPTSSDDNYDTSQSDAGVCFRKEEKHENIDSGLELSSSTSSNENDNVTVTQEKSSLQFEVDILFGIYDDVYKSTLFDVVEIDLISRDRSSHSASSDVKVNTTKELTSNSKCVTSTNIYNTKCDGDCCSFSLNLLFYQPTRSILKNHTSTYTCTSVESVKSATEEMSAYSPTDLINHTPSVGFNKDAEPTSAKNIHSPIETSTPNNTTRFQMNNIGLTTTKILPFKMASSTRPIPKSPVLSRAPSLPSISERSPTKCSPHVKSLLDASTSSRNKAFTLRSCGRVLRSTKENKQSVIASTLRPQTPHMKSYIALRQQCRRNDSLRESYVNGGNKKLREKKILDACELSLNTAKTNRTGLSRPPSSATRRRSVLTRKYCQRLLQMETSESEKVVIHFEGDVKNISKALVERKTFSGHLRRWQREELMQGN